MDREALLNRRAAERVGAVLREKWTLERLIGVGGMASVYAARHRNGKLGAVKLLHLELSMDPDWRERFLREGYVANTIGHPGVVSVLDDDVTEDGAVFLVMELLEGEPADVRALQQPRERLEAREVRHIADGILDVLVAAHAKGIIHRDVKPENIFITREGQVKVLDFGIARLREKPAGSSSTRTGATMGTPAYMPPEQALGHNNQIDERTDLWALGATMFTLLTGRYVHEADTANKILLAAMTRPAPQVRTLVPEVSPAFAAIVDKALAFEQKDRFQSAAEMQQALRALSDEALTGPADAPLVAPALTLSAPRAGALTASAVARDSIETRSRRRGGPMLAAAVAVAGVAIGIGAFVMLRGGSDPATATPEPASVAAPAAPPPAVEPAATAAPPTASSAQAPPPEPSEEVIDLDAPPPQAGASAAGAPTAPRPAPTAPTTRGTAPVKPPPTKKTADPLGKW